MYASYFFIYVMICYLPPLQDAPKMRKDKRISKGENNFRTYVIPAISEWYPGLWQSTNGTIADTKYGIDWYYTGKDCSLSVSARVWECCPKQWFGVRWKRESAPKRALEVTSRIKALENGTPISDLTIEGFIWQSWVYIAIIPSRILWEAVQVNLDALETFPVRNEYDVVHFKRVPFSLFEPDQIKKIVVPIASFL